MPWASRTTPVSSNGLRPRGYGSTTTLLLARSMESLSPREGSGGRAHASVGEVPSGDLLDSVLRAHRQRAEQPLDRFQVERRLEHAPAGQPIELARAERESIPVVGQRKHLLASLRRGRRGEEGHLELAVRALH